jgi:ligand-binding SRPBCC domain-containing protein
MPHLTVETFIKAPPHRCFDLVRTGVQTARSAHRGAEYPVETGDTATFKSRALGISIRVVMKAVAADRPNLLVDEMISGPFKMFKHRHEFIPTTDGTLLRDSLDWTLPFGAAGRLADALFIRRLLRKTVTKRNAELKKIAAEKPHI